MYIPLTEYGTGRELIINSQYLVCIRDLPPKSQGNLGPRTLVDYIAYGKNTNNISRVIVNENCEHFKLFIGDLSLFA